MSSLQRIAALFGIAIGVLFGLLAVSLTEAIVVSGSATNPACGIVGFLCSWGVVPSQITGSFTIDGLGILIVQTMLLAFVVVAVAGLFLFVLLRRDWRVWAVAVVGAVLGFLAAFALGYGIMLWAKFSAVLDFYRQTLGINLSESIIWRLILPWLIGGVLAAIATVLFLRAMWRRGTGGEAVGG
jgi:hypothetical protein